MMSRTARLVLLLASGAVLALSGGSTWVRAAVPAATGEVALEVGGQQLPLLAATGVVFIAAALALPLARPTTARVIGALVGVAALGAFCGLVAFTFNPNGALDLASRAATGLGWHGGSYHFVPLLAVPYLALTLAGFGGLSFALFPGGGRPGSRFETAPEQARSARNQALDDWDALGRGEDPSSFSDRLSTRERSDNDR